MLFKLKPFCVTMGAQANVFDASQETPEAAKARVTKEKRAEMVAQNALGVDFFDMNNDGAQTGKNVDTVVRHLSAGVPQRFLPQFLFMRQFRFPGMAFYANIVKC